MPHRAHHGHVAIIPFTAGEMTPGAVTTTITVPIPYNCRIMELSISAASSAGGAARATINVTDGTNNIISSTLTLNGGATAAIYTPTSSPGLVAAQRTRLRGQSLVILLLTVASEKVTGLAVHCHVRVDSHVPVSPADE